MELSEFWNGPSIREDLRLSEVYPLSRQILWEVSINQSIGRRIELGLLSEFNSR